MSPRLRVVWHWLSMGPYHFARMGALAQIREVELTVVESACTDDHGWIRDDASKSFDMITLSSGRRSTRVLKDTAPALANVLRCRRPDVVVSAGYFEPHSFSAVRAYRKDFPASIMVCWSESTQIDQPRYWWREFIKRFFVSVFDGALVAGEPHASYLQQLGMQGSDIQIVGNCVDNDFFSTQTDEARCRMETDPSLTVPPNFFLYVGRMIPEKNLPRLLEAYRLYKERAGSGAWDLVLVGTGPEEASLRQQAEAFGVDGIWFAGLRQVDEVPRYYARARCLVLPSLSEPWGLVVNEAMASGIPVLVSNRCGCAVDLVRDGVNGFLFDPLKPRFLADLFFMFSSGGVPIESIGANGRKAVAEFSPKSFALRAANHLQSLYTRKGQQPRKSYRAHLIAGGTDFMSSVWAQLP